MACLGLGAVMELIVAGHSSRTARLTLLGAVAGAVVVICATVFAAERATRREHRIFGQQASALEDLQRRLGELGFLVSRGRQELHGLAEQIAASEAPPLRAVDTRPAGTGDPVVNLAHELQKAQNEAWNILIHTASLRVSEPIPEAPKPDSDPAQRVDVFVNLSRRMQSLTHRAIQGLDELENQVEDPDLLKGLFRVDHLITRLRRQAESLSVIGGAASRRQWSRPVTVYEVLRSAIAEVEHFSRVKVVRPVEGTLDGGAVADVIHLFAELVENATRFAPPHTQVFLRAEAVTAGIAIEIEDRGLGIPREAQHRLNDLLDGAEPTVIDELVRDGRIGLLVVSALSRRHRITVRLQTNLYGGTQAVVVLPNDLIGSGMPQTIAAAAPVEPATAVPASPRPIAGSEQGTTQASAPSGVRVGDPSEVRTDQSAVPPGSGAQRPGLPRRRPQANMAPELLNAPTQRDDPADTSHNYGLMAAFQRGVRSGEEEDLTDGTGGTG